MAIIPRELELYGRIMRPYTGGTITDPLPPFSLSTFLYVPFLSLLIFRIKLPLLRYLPLQFRNIHDR